MTALKTKFEPGTYTNLVRDGHGIWVNPSDCSESSRLDYPAKGNQECFGLEDRSFWFRHRNLVIEATIKKFPFKGEFLDVGGIGLFDVIEHIADVPSFLSIVSAALSPGSRFYITVPAYNFFWSDVDIVSGHYHRYSKTMLSKLAAALKLTVDFVSDFFFYLPMPLLLQRVLPYRLGLRRNRQDEQIRNLSEKLVMGGTADNFLEYLSAVELELIKRRLVPFGGSLFAVLSK